MCPPWLLVIQLAQRRARAGELEEIGGTAHGRGQDQPRSPLVQAPPISAPYEATVGASARAMAGFEHVANSGPRKVAQLVLTIAGLEEPPLRILAGSDAYEYGRQAWRHRVETDETWQHLSRSADHDEAGDAWQQQRGKSLPTLGA